MILDTVHDYCRQSGCRAPEFQVFLNDLPGNDFNTVFRMIPSFYEKIGACFISGTPGSFYGRLFPAESLHFVNSASSLHWLSQVPPRLVGDLRNSSKGGIALVRTSPPSVFDAYLRQFEEDFKLFLKLRSIEVAPGGCMVLTLMGRGIENPLNEECRDFWDDLVASLRELVVEGVVEEEKVDSCNMPYYEPYKDEVLKVIQEEGSFNIIQLEESPRPSIPNDDPGKLVKYNVLTKIVRAILEPMLVNHFGSSVIDKLFTKFQEKMLQGGYRMSVVLYVSLTRKK